MIKVVITTNNSDLFGGDWAMAPLWQNIFFTEGKKGKHGLAPLCKH